MKRLGFASFVTAMSTGFTLLFSIGAGHILLVASMMPDMGKQMSQSQCQSSCTSQSPVANPGQKINIDNKDIEPRPVEPYYLVFTSVGWSTTLLLSAYLLRHLRWRPPNIFKLNVNYQF